MYKLYTVINIEILCESGNTYFNKPFGKFHFPMGQAPNDAKGPVGSMPKLKRYDIQGSDIKTNICV